MFACTGGLAGLCQILILAWLVARGWQPVEANMIAFMGGAQVNFVLSAVFTWGDTARGVWSRRWLLYHGAVFATAPLNALAFSVVRHVAPLPLAAVAGIAVAGVANYFLGDRLVFAAPRLTGMADRSTRPAPIEQAQEGAC
jgi:putative flippase GtrA